MLSENEAIYSEPSVVIITNEEGAPESAPIVEQIGAVDQTRIMVSWKSGVKGLNGPILSYRLKISDLTKSGYTAEKVDQLSQFKSFATFFLIFADFSSKTFYLLHDFMCFIIYVNRLTFLLACFNIFLDYKNLSQTYENSRKF